MKYFVGSRHVMDDGLEVEIVEVLENRRYVIKSVSGEYFEKNVSYSTLSSKKFLNPFKKTVYGVGFFGYGEYDRKNSEKEYKLWLGVVGRCYSGRQSCYDNVGISDEWLNFQNFCRDVKTLDGYNKWLTSEAKYHFDKDAKNPDAPKKYCKENCRFILAEENICSGALNNCKYLAIRLSDGHRELFSYQKQFLEKYDMENYRGIAKNKLSLYYGWKFVTVPSDYNLSERAVVPIAKHLAIRLSDGYEEYFDEVKSFEEKHGLSRGSIWRYFNTENMQCGGWIFIRFGEYEKISISEKTIVATNNVSEKMDIFGNGSNEMRSFMNNYGLTKQGIDSVLNHKHKTHKDWCFVYAKEYMETNSLTKKEELKIAIVKNKNNEGKFKYEGTRLEDGYVELFNNQTE